jgi:hypothetical protein
MTLDAARQAGTSAVGEVLEMTHDKTKGVPMQVTSADRLRTHHAVRQASRLGRLATHGVSEAEIEKMIRLDVAWGQGHRGVPGPAARFAGPCLQNPPSVAGPHPRCGTPLSGRQQVRGQ